MPEFLKALLARFDDPTPPIVAYDATTPDEVAQFAVIKDGYKVVETPKGKAATPTRVHTFADAPSLIAWLKRYAKPESAEVFADPVEAKIVAYCGPAWTSDRVTCAVALDPMFAQLAPVLGKTLSQEGLRTLLSNLRPYLQEKDAIGRISTFDAKISGEVTSHLDPRTGARRLKMVSAGVEYPIELPPELTFTLPIYESGPVVSVVVTLCPYVEQGKAPSFALTWPERASVLSEAFRAEVERVREGLGEGWLVMLGTGARA